MHRSKLTLFGVSEAWADLLETLGILCYSRERPKSCTRVHSHRCLWLAAYFVSQIILSLPHANSHKSTQEPHQFSTGGGRGIPCLGKSWGACDPENHNGVNGEGLADPESYVDPSWLQFMHIIIRCGAHSDPTGFTTHPPWIHRTYNWIDRKLEDWGRMPIYQTREPTY